jgi:hypothetical protein
MSSSDSFELDLERGLPTTAADVEALRRLSQSQSVSTEQYLRFLACLTPATPAALRGRPGPQGPPFVLP